MNVLAALGDAPTAAIAVIAILLGIVVVVRGRRGEREGDEKPAPSLLAVPATGSEAVADDGLQKMAVHDIGHGTIRLGGVASPNTETGPPAAAYAPLLPPTVAEPEPDAVPPASEPIAAPSEPEPQAAQPLSDAAKPQSDAAQPQSDAAQPQPEAEPPQPEPQPPAWMALRSPSPDPVPQTWDGSQLPAASEEAPSDPESPPWSPPPTLAPEPAASKGKFRPGKIRRRKKPPGE